MGLLFNPFRHHIHTENPQVVISVEGAHRRGDPQQISTSTAPRVNSFDTSDETWTIDKLKAALESEVAAIEYNEVYDRKSKLINLAMRDLGLGKYQWQLFGLCGFGWFADKLWLQALAVILSSLQREFSIPSNKLGYTTTSLYIGLCIGATLWGISSDIIGRRIAFNASLAIVAVFGLAVGGAPSWIGTAAIFACIGTGLGGNIPVDGALFLEFIPGASGNLLTLLSAWWPVGQLYTSVIAWAFIPDNSCTAAIAKAGRCERANNMGWRYTMLTLGATTMVLFLARFLLLHILESPKFYLSQGRDADAVAVVHEIAARNGTKTWLTLELLQELSYQQRHETKSGTTEKLSTSHIIRSKLATFSADHIKPLFRDRRLALNTSLLWFCWIVIGLGYPLFNAFLPLYLTQSRGSTTPKPNSIVYRNYMILSLCGVPGSILAYFLVDIRWLGRRGTMGIATGLSGVFIFLFTVSTDEHTQLAFSSLEAFFQNIMYGVLVAYSSECFPGVYRGTGNGIAHMLNRIAGFCAPIIATNTIGIDPRIPVYVSGALLLAASVAMFLLPIETRGRQKL